MMLFFRHRRRCNGSPTPRRVALISAAVAALGSILGGLLKHGFRGDTASTIALAVGGLFALVCVGFAVWFWRRDREGS